MLPLHTTPEVALGLAGRLKALRLERNWSRATLAERSGVSLGSLIRFERTGRVSLKHLLHLTQALGRLGDFDSLLDITPRAPEAITDFERRATTKTRKRGRQ